MGLSDTAQSLAREVLIHGPISRSALGDRLGLSPASLTRLSRPFIDRGLFVELGEASDGTVGRPVKPLDVRAEAGRFIGAKLTGESVLAVLTDLRAGVIAEVEYVLPDHAPSAVVVVVAAAVRELVARAHGARIAGVGISIGGKVTGGRIVTRAPFLEWHDVALADLVEAAVDIPVVVENDVVALTEAEHWFGRAKGEDGFAVITIGAGVGYGLVMNGRVVSSPDTGLGLGGHVPLDPTGPLCPDGHRGCARAMLSIPSMCGQIASVLGRPVDYDELIALARDGVPVAAAVVDAAARALGRLIALSANLTMHPIVVLGGEGIALWRLREASIREAADADRDPDASPLDLRIDESGFISWSRGAAAVAIQAALARLEFSPTT